MKIYAPTARHVGNLSGATNRLPGRLKGRVLGVLSNGKPNATTFLTKLGECIAHRQRCSSTLILDKKKTPDPIGAARGLMLDKLGGAPRWMLEQLSGQAAAVLVGNGD